MKIWIHKKEVTNKNYMCSIVNAEALACLGGKEGVFSLDPLVSAGENAWLDGQATLQQI